MLFLSDYRPNKVNVTGFRIKQGFKTSLAALLPPPERMKHLDGEGRSQQTRGRLLAAILRASLSSGAVKTHGHFQRKCFNC